MDFFKLAAVRLAACEARAAVGAAVSAAVGAAAVGVGVVIVVIAPQEVGGLTLGFHGL